MKSHSTRTRPNVGLIMLIVTSGLFWATIIKMFFAEQIKEWISFMLSLLS